MIPPNTFSAYCFLKPKVCLVLTRDPLGTKLPFHVDLVYFLSPATWMLEKKEETQDLPNTGHPHLKIYEDTLLVGA